MKQKIKSEETQKLLMESAFALFYKRGYDATSIADIVKQANLSKGAFYHHFTNKEEIGEKTVQQLLNARMYRGMIQPLKNAQTQNTIDVLIDVFTKRINGFSAEETKLGCPLNNLINEIGYSQETIRLLLRGIIEEWKQALTKFIETGQQRGEVSKNISAQLVATYLISAFEGARGIGKLYDDQDALQDYLSAAIAYLNMLRN